MKKDKKISQIGVMARERETTENKRECECVSKRRFVLLNVKNKLIKIRSVVQT